MLIAYTIANKTSAFLFLVNSPKIISKIARESKLNLRKVFKEAEKNLLVIIFINKINLIAPKHNKTSSKVKRCVVL